MSNLKPPYTVVELVEEMPETRTPEEQRLVRTTHVVINGKPVTVARDGIYIESGEPLGGDYRAVIKIVVELLVDEFHIHRVPHGYTNGTTAPPRDSLGRFTKRN